MPHQNLSTAVINFPKCTQKIHPKLTNFSNEWTISTLISSFPHSFKSNRRDSLDQTSLIPSRVASTLGFLSPDAPSPPLLSCDDSSSLPRMNARAGRRRRAPGHARPSVVLAQFLSPTRDSGSSPFASPARLPRLKTLAPATSCPTVMAAVVALRPRTRRGDAFTALEDAV